MSPGIFEKLTHNHRRLFSTHHADTTHTKHHLNRLHRYHQINTTILLITILMIGLLSFVIITTHDKKPEKILGLTSNLHITPPSSLFATDTSRQYCLQNGGQVISIDGGERETCRFLDGTECDLDYFFQNESCPIPTTVTIPNKVITAKPMPQPTQSSQHIYYLTLAKKSNPAEHRLSDFLINVLDINPPTNLTNIYYDTRQGSPHDKDSDIYNFSYYLVTTSPIPTGNFDTYAANIAIQTINNGITPFLNHSEYCNTDLDCTIRDNFCAYGAFNYFQVYADGWMCRGKTDQQGRELVFYDEQKQCKAEKTLAAPQCLNNLCTPTQATFACIIE